jgi:hypothetical protein
LAAESEGELRTQSVLGRAHRRVYLAMLLQPIDIPALRPRFHFTEKLHDLWVKACLARIGVGDDGLYLNRHYEMIGSH